MRQSIRYAAPPTGNLRWQAPQAPAVNRTVVTADTFASICPQANLAIPNVPFTGLANEDCLFLNVYAAPTAAAATTGNGTETKNRGNRRLVLSQVYHGWTLSSFPVSPLLLSRNIMHPYPHLSKTKFSRLARLCLHPRWRIRRGRRDDGNGCLYEHQYQHVHRRYYSVQGEHFCLKLTYPA